MENPPPPMITSNANSHPANEGGFLTRLNNRDGFIRRFSRRYGRDKAADMERLIKFLLVGGLGAVIDLGLTNLIMFAIHVQDGDTAGVLFAGTVGFTTAVFSNFFWNRYWTYPDSRSRSIRKQLALFFMINAFGLAIRALVLRVMSQPFTDLVRAFTESVGIALDQRTDFKIGANMAIMMALVIVALWNFGANRVWTYGDVSKESAPGSKPDLGN
jgi:putative flippase GtrA